MRIKRLVLATLMAIPFMGALAPPAQACIGDVCAAVNLVCRKTIKQDCLG